MTEQVPFAAASFAENPEPRCPCLLQRAMAAKELETPAREWAQARADLDALA